MREKHDAPLYVLVTSTMSVAVKCIADEEDISMGQYVRSLIDADMKQRDIKYRKSCEEDRIHGSSVPNIGQKAHR